MDPAARICGDTGTPVIIAKPKAPSAKALKDISERVAARISVEAFQNNSPTINVI
jgi:hypothetical protein